MKHQTVLAYLTVFLPFYLTAQGDLGDKDDKGHKGDQGDQGDQGDLDD